MKKFFFLISLIFILSNDLSFSQDDDTTKKMDINKEKIKETSDVVSTYKETLKEIMTPQKSVQNHIGEEYCADEEFVFEKITISIIKRIITHYFTIYRHHEWGPGYNNKPGPTHDAVVTTNFEIIDDKLVILEDNITVKISQRNRNDGTSELNNSTSGFQKYITNFIKLRNGQVLID